MSDSFNVFVEHTPADPSICLYKSESRDQKRSEVNRGRSPVGGFKGSVKDLRKQAACHHIVRPLEGAWRRSRA